jgi:hypothetical protein
MTLSRHVRRVPPADDQEGISISEKALEDYRIDVLEINLYTLIDMGHSSMWKFCRRFSMEKRRSPQRMERK